MEFTQMVTLSQQQLKEQVALELERMGYRTQVQNGFVYAPGAIPVLLVAHLDTVHPQPVKHLVYSADRTTIRSPQGIGGDDRCGVHLILRVLQKHRCHVLFCEDEETGGLGARAFTAAQLFPAVHYMVELDRQGADDAVFYECGNDAFMQFVCSFGFTEARGTFSDISILAPHLDLAAVNLSAGYYRAHTLREYVNLQVMETVYQRLCRMVQTETGRFAYLRKPPLPPLSAGYESMFDRALRHMEQTRRQQTAQGETPADDT